jgi:hypothetical protein
VTSRDSDVIERDLEQTRERLDATISALQEKLSPGQLLDQALDYAKHSGGTEFGRNLGRNVRDHPLPVALVGIGLSWLMMSEPKDRRRRDWDDVGDEYGYTPGLAEARDPYLGRSAYAADLADGPDYYDSDDDLLYGQYRSYDELDARMTATTSEITRSQEEPEETYHSRLQDARGKLLGISRGASESLDTFRSRIDEGLKSARERFSRMRHGASDRSRRARDSARRMGAYTRDGAYRMGDYAREQGRWAAGTARHGVDAATHGLERGRERAADYYHEQPLMGGVLGLAVGALLAMTLPRSRREEELLGDAGYRLRSRAREAASEAVDAAGRVVGEMASTGRAAAEREGLIPDTEGTAGRARDAIRDTTERARRVVEETTAAGRTAAEQEIESHSGTERRDQGL